MSRLEGGGNADQYAFTFRRCLKYCDNSRRNCHRVVIRSKPDCRIVGCRTRKLLQGNMGFHTRRSLSISTEYQWWFISIDCKGSSYCCTQMDNRNHGYSRGSVVLWFRASESRPTKIFASKTTSAGMKSISRTRGESQLTLNALAVQKAGRPAFCGRCAA
jgi:hypothetical protein